MSASADVFAVSAVTVARGSPYRVNSASKRRCDSFRRSSVKTTDLALSTGSVMYWDRRT